jgi:hypothetical protein
MLDRLCCIPRQKMSDRPSRGVADWSDLGRQGPDIGHLAQKPHQLQSNILAVARALMELPLRILHCGNTAPFVLSGSPDSAVCRKAMDAPSCTSDRHVCGDSLVQTRPPRRAFQAAGGWPGQSRPSKPAAVSSNVLQYLISSARHTRLRIPISSLVPAPRT